MSTVEGFLQVGIVTNLLKDEYLSHLTFLIQSTFNLPFPNMEVQHFPCYLTSSISSSIFFPLNLCYKFTNANINVSESFVS